MRLNIHEIFSRIHDGKTAKLKDIIFSWLFNNTFRVHMTVERMRNTRNSKLRVLRSLYLERKHSLIISGMAQIGEGLLMPHPIAIVVGKAIIGNRCTIFQQVTIGQKNNKWPIIGDDVTIYPGAKIIGDITIGDGAVIGAGAVVLKDVPGGAIVGGVPAKVLGWVDSTASITKKESKTYTYQKEREDTH